MGDGALPSVPLSSVGLSTFPFQPTEVLGTSSFFSVLMYARLEGITCGWEMMVEREE